MNCNDCGGFLPGCRTCDPFGARRPRGVATADTGRVRRLQDAIEGECDGLAVDERHARAILAYVEGVKGGSDAP